MEGESGEEGGVEGGSRGCGLGYGFGFLSLREERRAIDSEAESEADRVAARGCTGAQREHDLNANKVTAGPPGGHKDRRQGTIYTDRSVFKDVT